MADSAMIINDNLLETIYYNTPTTPIKASYTYFSDFPGGITPCHWHRELECIVMLRGSLNYYVNNRTFTLQEGDGIIINSNRLHICGPAADEKRDRIHTYRPNDPDNGKYIVLLLHPDTLRFNHKMEEKYIDPLLLDGNSDVLFLDHSAAWHTDAIRKITEIFQAVTEQSPCFELTAQSRFFELWSIMYRHTVAQNGSEPIITDPMNPVKTMISYIQEHYQEKISLNDISGAGMMCQSKCCRLFRETVRRSPMEYLQNYRMQKGMEMLEHSDLSVTEIALECGFHGASYFTETFRKTNGITPREYRRRNREITASRALPPILQTGSDTVHSTTPPAVPSPRS